MQLIQNAFQYFVDLGMVVTFPIIIFCLGMLVGMKLSKAFRAAALTGIGFVGIFLVVSLLVSTLGGVIKAITENMHLKLNVVDIGWPVAAMIALSNAGIVVWVYLLGILLNIFL